MVLTSHFVLLQGSYAPAEEVPEAVWCPSEVGPEIPGFHRLFQFVTALELRALLIGRLVV